MDAIPLSTAIRSLVLVITTSRHLSTRIAVEMYEFGVQKGSQR